ncbi:MAG TPA: ComEC/Rec2 family competence protein, partial [Planctomycetota bacterium]|nr:ComEC/Rec2 family competence protein [Planctomycetota bacterium]
RGLLAATHAARGWLRETLKASLAPDKHTAPLLCALTLGDRTDVDDNLAEAFARTGTIHLLAVSGFNVAVVAWVVWTLTSLAGLGQRAAGALVLCAVGVYALVTGAPPSVVRAAVMSGAYVLSIMGRRQSDAVHAAALAALVLLAARPFDLFQPGFQLSFAAVLGILLLSEDLAAMLGPGESVLERVAGPRGVGAFAWIRHRLHRLAAATGSVSIAAWLAVLPLTAYYFHLFSPITVLVNLLVVPVAGFLTVFGFMHLGVAACSPMLACVPAFLARGATGLLTQTVMGVERLTAGWVYCAAPTLGWIVGYYALGLLVVARGRLGLSGRRAAMLWLLGVLVYVVAGDSGRPPKGLEATVLDVQDGAAAVLRFPDGATVLCDCGTYGRNDVGRWVVAPALWHWRVRAVDLLVVTHADADHVTGLPSLLDRFRVGRVVHSPVLERAAAGRQLLALLDERGIPHQSVAAGDRLVVGEGNVIEVLWPSDWSLRLRPDDQNENSLVFRVERGGRRVLFGGDIQQVGMAALLHGGVDPRTDALVVPHHGRRAPAAEAFAQATRPRYAICSIRPDHLPPDIVAAYRGAGAEVLVTGWDGAITVALFNGEVVATRARRREGRVRADIALDGGHGSD